VKLEDVVLPQTPGEEEGNRLPRRQPPDSPHPPILAWMTKILEAEVGAEAAARLAFPHHQAGGHHLG
jgi:hypothetical protein